MKYLVICVFLVATNLCSQKALGQIYLVVDGYVFPTPIIDLSNGTKLKCEKVEFIEYTSISKYDGYFKVWILKSQDKYPERDKIGYVHRGQLVYNNEYYSIMNGRDIIDQNKLETVILEEKELKKGLAEINAGLSKELPISSSINADVRTSIKENIVENNNKELNLHVEYFYEVVKAQIELKTDDYPAGFYTLNSSNAASLIANFIKKTLEYNLKKYLTQDRKISVIISGQTDASTVGSRLLYNGEFGDIENKLFFANGNLESINIRSNETIKNNYQLAFLRTQGLKSYIENNIPILKNTSLNFEQRAYVNENIGSQYRKIAVELIIHDAFQKKSEAKSENLTTLFLKLKNTVCVISNKEGQGSGFIINENGIGVSNYHVINSSNYRNSFITLDNRNSFEIEKIIEENEEIDYAIFKIKNPLNYTFNKTDISYLNSVIGEQVFAIGNPKNLANTISEGIVSGFRDNNNLIQTTTPIAPGSSGGALFNKKGEVIGITTQGIRDVGNLNFAVNIKLLKLERFK